ncbi:MAG: DUF2182 domain-containing protein [Candidatus Limnocylindrales bacterium]
MRSIDTSRQVPFAAVADATVLGARRVPLVLLAIAGAWTVAVVAAATGNAGLLHHHSLIEGRTPLWIAVALFVLGWQVMVVAMMLPPSLSTIRLVGRLSDRGPRPRLAEAAFLGAFLLAWTIFGVLAFAGDFVLHHVVDATPSLAARPWLIEAGVLAFAGAYQLTPLRRRSLAACRQRAGLPFGGAPRERGWFRVGLDHGLDCLGSSWGLMLLMFAEGFANLWWMAALTAVMVYEVNGRHGPRAARLAGVGLLVASLIVLSAPLQVGR